MKSYSLGRVFDCIGRFRVDLFLLRFRCSARIRYHQLHHSHDEQVVLVHLDCAHKVITDYQKDYFCSYLAFSKNPNRYTPHLSTTD